MFAEIYLLELQLERSIISVTLKNHTVLRTACGDRSSRTEGLEPLVFGTKSYIVVPRPLGVGKFFKSFKSKLFEQFKLFYAVHIANSYYHLVISTLSLQRSYLLQKAVTEHTNLYAVSSTSSPVQIATWQCY